MPRLKKRIEEEPEEEEEDEEEQFEEDELEQDPAPLETKGSRKKKAKPPEPKRRFGVVPPQPVRLIDAETNEVVGEGDFLITTALADILERLERIETNIGSMMEG